MVDDVLIGGTGLREGVQLVHVVHVSPQGRQVFLRNGKISTDLDYTHRKSATTYWYLKVDKVLAGHPDVLQPGHQLAVEAAHRVPGQEAGSAGRQVVVDFPQVRQQCVVLVLVLLDQHQLQLAVQVLDQGGHFLVLKLCTKLLNVFNISRD